MKHALYITLAVGLIVFGLYGLGNYATAPFNKFLVDNKCKVVVDFGKAVTVKTQTDGFSPKFQKVYVCENYPQMAILD